LAIFQEVKVPGTVIVQGALTSFFEGVNMNYRNAAFFAIAGLLASSGLARADALPSVKLSLDPTVVTADDAAAEPAPLMGALDKIGLGKALEDAKFDISGWIEGGYSFNNRHHSHEQPILPGPFNHEVGNHFMLNQVGLRIERRIEDPKVFDVGGLVEVMYGTDAGFMHSSGWGFNGNDPTDDGAPADTVSDEYRAFYQVDISQAYVDVSLPVGNGLTIRMGKFVSLLGNEYCNPNNNLFYSHSWIFNATPFSATGILGIYKLNEQWSVTAGVSRGWDMTAEDNNGAIDGLGAITYAPNEELSLSLAWNVGPQNDGDNSHYRTVLDPIITWQATKDLKLALECFYLYDGGANAAAAESTHAYGDVWSVATYASYTINDYLTLNGRVEAYHTSATSLGAVGAPFGGSLNIYSITLGTTITPLPANSVLKNLVIRPEVRYDFSDSSMNAPFSAGGRSFKDQLVFAADVIFKF
jgi:hypothetical protein